MFYFYHSCFVDGSFEIHVFRLGVPMCALRRNACILDVGCFSVLFFLLLVSDK